MAMIDELAQKRWFSEVNSSLRMR